MIRTAEAMIKLDPAELHGFFGENVRACLRKISVAEGGTYAAHVGGDPHRLHVPIAMKYHRRICK